MASKARGGPKSLPKKTSSAVGKRSEIDDIFASVKSGRSSKISDGDLDKSTLPKSAAQSSVNGPKPDSKSPSIRRAEKSRTKAAAGSGVTSQTPGAVLITGKRQHEPESEVVFDPSTSIDSKMRTIASKSNLRPSKRHKNTVTGKHSDLAAQKAQEEDLKFIDSRGTGPRKRTEEGYLIYKEDELGITDKGGGF
ncbi:hypothetical protein FRB99_002204 [Tulasnella sp. 403]|nr:hypothetical protein FRB99_002204 [Tulasnella sp. 403]